jgi:hypothetical protein
VARPPKLRLALLLLAVLLAHLVGMEWLARKREKLAALPQMPPPMYTRLLKPVEPPPVLVAAKPEAPAPRPRRRPAAVPPQPVASQPQVAASAPEVVVAERAPEPPPPEPQAVVPEPPALVPDPPAPEPPAIAAASPASAPASAAAATPAAAAASAAMAAWPADTRLSYRLGGIYLGGPLFGDARVFWQREGEKYQVRLDAAVKVLGRTVISQTLASQGEVTPQGLLPRAYEETRPGKRRGAQFGDEVLQLENGKTAPRPPGLQDTASQFVELGHRFATGREKLEVGSTVTFWMARPGAVDQWTYDVVGREMVQTPHMGDVEAFHLKPRPIANPRGNITAEMWFAPSLQYLPVRIKVVMGADAYMDLVVEKIEQR